METCMIAYIHYIIYSKYHNTKVCTLKRKIDMLTIPKQTEILTHNFL